MSVRKIKLKQRLQREANQKLAQQHLASPNNPHNNGLKPFKARPTIIADTRPILLPNLSQRCPPAVKPLPLPVSRLTTRVPPASADAERQLPKLTTKPAAPRVKRRGLFRKTKINKKASRKTTKAPWSFSFRPRLRRRPLRKRSAWLRDPAHDYCGIFDLQSVLGLQQHQIQEDVTLFSIDCEWQRIGIVERISEIGVSTLRMRDVKDVPFLPYGTEWMKKMQHHHIVVDIGENPESRMAGSYFGRSILLSPDAAKQRLMNIITSLGPQNGDGHVFIVGQSVMNDVRALRLDPAFRIDLLESPRAGLNCSNIFDTYEMAQDAQELGAGFPEMGLGPLSYLAGFDPSYHRRYTLMGLHNAANDAAYALTTLLLLGHRWNDITEHGALKSGQEWHDKRGGLLPKVIAVNERGHGPSFDPSKLRESKSPRKAPRAWMKVEDRSAVGLLTKWLWKLWRRLPRRWLQ